MAAQFCIHQFQSSWLLKLMFLLSFRHWSVGRSRSSPSALSSGRLLLLPHWSLPPVSSHCLGHFLPSWLIGLSGPFTSTSLPRHFQSPFSDHTRPGLGGSPLGCASESWVGWREGGPEGRYFWWIPLRFWGTARWPGDFSAPLRLSAPSPLHASAHRCPSPSRLLTTWWTLLTLHTQLACA